MFGGHLVGSFFLPGGLTVNAYSKLLQDLIDPVLTDIKSDNHYLENQLLFQQDGAALHFALPVCEYLFQTFLYLVP